MQRCLRTPALLLPHHASLRSLRRGAIFLTDLAVEFRYSGETASKRQSASALRWSTKIRGERRRVLGTTASKEVMRCLSLRVIAPSW